MMRSHKVRSLSCAVQESVRRVEVQQTERGRGGARGRCGREGEGKGDGVRV